MKTSKYLLSTALAVLAIGCSDASSESTSKVTSNTEFSLAANAASVALGAEHTCAITTTGGVKCWGDNRYGQLGNNSTARTLEPVAVAGLSSGVKAITAGANHTCALTTTVAYCWGLNASGQLGDGSTVNRLVPVRVLNFNDRDLTSVVAGGYHTCAIFRGDTVFCWGDNTYGQLGNDSHESQAVPVQAYHLAAGTQAIALGYRHGCAISYGTRISCWGQNSDGQLGIDSTTDQAKPEEVWPLEGAPTQIAAGGHHTCAVFANLPNGSSGIKCWGYNEWGQIGTGAISRYELKPKAVIGMSGASDVVAGKFHSCGTVAGKVSCWGYNGVGQLGNNSTITSSTPVAVFGTNVAGVGWLPRANYTDHSCALTSEAGLQCWGSNNSGELGIDSLTDSWMPVRVHGL